MPIYSIQGPDGKIYEIEGPAGATKAQVVAAIQAKMQAPAPAPQPEAAPAPIEPPKKEGFGAALGKGIENILSPSRTAIGALTGSAEEAALSGLKRAEESPYADQVSLEKVKQAYERGLLPAAGEVLRQIPLAITEQLPNIGATLGSARLGAMAGAPLGPYGAIGGGILGAVAPSLLQQFGGNIQRQAQEQLEAKQPVDISRTAAAAAAVPQAGLDVAATFIPLGRTVAGSVLGPQVKQLLERGAKESAEQLARESLPKVLAKGAGISIATEAPTEALQSMLERAQAGLPLLSEDALKEYGEAAYQASLIAPIGAAARVGERSTAREQVRPPEVRPGETDRQAAERIQAELLAMKEAAKPPAPGPILDTNKLYNLMAQPNGYALVEQYKQRLAQLPETEETKAAIDEASFIQRRSVIESLERQPTKAVLNDRTLKQMGFRPEDGVYESLLGKDMASPDQADAITQTLAAAKAQEGVAPALVGKIDNAISVVNDLQQRIYPKAKEDVEQKTPAAPPAPPAPSPVLDTNNLYNLIAQPNGYALVEQYKQRLTALPQTQDIKAAIDEAAFVQRRSVIESLGRQPTTAVLNDRSLKNSGFKPKDGVYESLLGKDIANPDEAAAISQTLETVKAQEKVSPALVSKIDNFLVTLNEFQDSIYPRGKDAGQTITPPSGEGVQVAGEPGAGVSTERPAAPVPGGVVPVVEDVGQPAGRAETQPAAVTAKAPKGPTLIQQSEAFGQAIGAVRPYRGDLAGRKNLPAEKAVQAGDFQGVVNALEGSKNVTVAEVARKAKDLGTNIAIDPDAAEMYERQSPVMRQLSIDGAKMHLEALEKIRALAPQVDALPDRADLAYALRDEKITAIDGGEEVGPMSLENIAEMGHSMFAPLPTGPIKLRTKEDFKALQQAFEQVTQEVGEDPLRLTSTGSAKMVGVAGVYDADTDTIRVPNYAARREDVLAHEIVHAQTAKAIAKPTTAQRPAVQRLEKLHQYVKAKLEEKAKTVPYFRMPYGIESLQEFVAEGMSNPRFQFELNQIEYKSRTAWDSFVQTVANLLGIQKNTAFTELLGIYGQLTAPPPPKAVKTAAAKKHPATVMGSPLLALVSRRLNGLDPALMSEFSTRFITKQLDKSGRPIVRTRNPMVTGFGNLFREGGTGDYVEIATMLEEEGYLEPGAVERDYKEAGERAKDLIKAALNREEVQTLDEQREEQLRSEEESARLQQEDEEKRAAAEEAAVDKAFEEGAEQTDEEFVAGLRGMGFTEKEIAEELEGRKTKPAKKSLVEMRKRYEAARAAPAPVETKPEPTELDKEIEAKTEELGRVLSRIMGRFGLKDVALNLVEDMKAEGEYAQSVIRLALDAASPVQALRHESIHALKELGFFTPQQWSVLEKQAKSKWVDEYLKNVNINKEPLGEGEKSRYDAYMDLYKGDMDAIIEEAIADAFGDFDVNKAPPGMMQAILNRLRNFFDAVKTAFGGEITAEQVFRKVEKGALKAEAAPATKAVTKASLRGEGFESFDEDYPTPGSVAEGFKRGDLLVHARTKDDTDFRYGIEPSLGEFVKSTESYQGMVEQYGDAPELTFFSDNTSDIDSWAKFFAKRDKPVQMVFVRKSDSMQKSLGNGKVMTSDGKTMSYEMSPLADYENELMRGEPAFVETGDWYTNKDQDVVAVMDYAPAAKPSLRAPQTEAFKKWFGNSKVVDENGDPLVVYHGSDAEFDIFDTEEGAFFFGGKGAKSFAEIYGDNITPVYLSIKKPFKGTYEDLAGADFDVLAKNGYDGAVFVDKESGLQQWVAFKPTQIKSATGNIGTFDAKKPDIRYSLRDAAKIDLDRSLNDKRISPRLPTAVKAKEDAMGKVRLQPDLDTFKSDDAAFRHNIALMSEYPNFSHIKGTPAQRAEQMIEHMKGNLLWLFNSWDAKLRDRSKLWYVGGNRISHRWAEKYGIPAEQAAGIIAALSPQKDWFQNVSLAERTLDALVFNADTTWSPEMTRVFKERAWAKKFPLRKYQGTTLKDMYRPGDAKSLVDMAVWIRAWDEANNVQTARVITPEGTFTNEMAAGKTGKPVAMRAQSFAAMVKTLQVLQQPDLQVISDLIGKNHKVRSFYNNIIAPYAGDDVTIDTHAVAAALLRPLGSSDLEVYHNFGSAKPAKKDKEGNILVPASAGTKNSAVTGLYGTYAMYAEAYRRAAQEAGVLPREMQSITWEAIRGLFRPEQKQAKLKNQTNVLWNKVGKGEIDGQTARDEISKLVSGIEDPAWAKSPVGANESRTDSSYADELPGVSVPGREPAGVPSGIGERVAGAVPEGGVKFSLRSTIPTATRQRIVQTTVARDEKTFYQRIIEAISPNNFQSFRADALNRYDQLSVYDKKLAQKMGGKALLASSSAESAALFSDLGAGLTASALGVHDRMGGVPVYRNGVTIISNQNGTVKGPTAIFAPLAKYNDPFAYQAYQFWAGVKRGSRFLADGREQLFEPADIQKAESLRKQFLKDGVDFNAIQKEWIKYNDGLVDYMLATGVLSKERADIYKKHSDYLPFYRQMDGVETVGPKIFQSISGIKPPKKLKGGEAPIDDFLENIVRNTQSAIQAGIKNIAAQRAADVAVKIQMADRLDYHSTAPNVFHVYENGKPVSYVTQDQLFINAVKSLGLPDLPFIWLFSGPANLLRNLVTKDPGFMLANLMRDSMSAWVTSGVKMKPMVDTISNFGSALAGKSPEFQALMNSGILGGYEFSQNVEASGRQFGKALRKQANVKQPGMKGVLEMGTKPLTSLWEALEKGSTASDAATRMEVYKRTLAETGNEAEALYRALEVMNFNRKGSSAVVRVLTAAVPFLNARMQGLDVLYRAATGKMNVADAKQVQRNFFIRGATIAALSTFYWALTHDDDEYKKQEQETRDNYWLLPSLGVKIPIPFEIGVLFKVIPERILGYTMGSDTGEDFLKSMARQLTSTLAFNPIPQTVLPVVESMTNFSFFTMRPIVGQGLEGLQPAYQVGPGTSRLAEAIGGATKSLPTELQISPAKLDNLINGYTGTMGMYMVNLMDAIFDMNTDSPKPSRRFEQMPLIRRFAIDPEARGSVTAYYELKNSVDAIVRTSNMLERTMNYEELPGYLQDNMRMLATKDYLLDLEKTMKEFREMKILIRSAKMSAEAKGDAIASIEKMENQLTANIQYLKSLAKGG